MPYLRKEYNIKRIAIFGSAIREDFNEESDIDLVVEFERPIGFKFLELCDFFETLFKRKVDIITSEGLKTIRIKEVKESIEGSMIYV